MEIPDSKYDQLLTYIETGAKGDLTDEMVRYIELLDTIRSMFTRYQSRDVIINFLQKPPYNLSRYHAIKRFTDAVNFFYLDNEIKKSAWRNWYAEKLDRAADLVLKTATSSKDIDIYKNILLAASEMRQLNKEDKEELPEELFKKPVKLYTLNPELIGRKKANRDLLGKHIDALDVPEIEKKRMKSDAMVTDVEFVTENESPED